jgi:Na+-translocating ferredoxin:NAD+ oxidoreductase RnfD subunit
LNGRLHVNDGGSGRALLPALVVTLLLGLPAAVCGQTAARVQVNAQIVTSEAGQAAAAAVRELSKRNNLRLPIRLSTGLAIAIITPPLTPVSLKRRPVLAVQFLRN